MERAERRFPVAGHFAGMLFPNDLVDQDDPELAAGDFQARWMVAADGGRSVIRKELGIDFDGTDPQLVGYQAIADFDDPGQLSRGWT